MGCFYRIFLNIQHFWWRRYQEEAKVFVLACLGGLILNTGLKLFFSKPRPELWHQLISEKSFSFPSGHALGSMVLYGFIAHELANHYPNSAKIIYSLTVILIAAIGISRLYFRSSLAHRHNCRLWSRFFMADDMYYDT